MKSQRNRIFLDIETTGLHLTDHQITEIGYVIRTPNGNKSERVIYPDHSLEGASERALEITKYYERIANRRRTPLREAISMFLSDVESSTIVGANPSFDVARIQLAAIRVGLDANWHPRLIDVEGLTHPYAEGGIEGDVPGLRECARILGVQYESDMHHGALYDARLAMAVYDEVVARKQNRGSR